MASCGAFVVEVKRERSAAFLLDCPASARRSIRLSKNSAAALRLKVRAIILLGSTPARMSVSNRLVSWKVLPEPAEAKIIWWGSDMANSMQVIRLIAQHPGKKGFLQNHHTLGKQVAKIHH